MVLRIIAAALNVLVILLALLSLLGGGICFAVFGIFAGAFNLMSLWKGLDYQESKFNTMGMVGNVLVFINGVVAIFQAMSASGAEDAVFVALLWAIGLVFISAGVVSLIAVAKMDR